QPKGSRARARPLRCTRRGLCPSSENDRALTGGPDVATPPATPPARTAPPEAVAPRLPRGPWQGGAGCAHDPCLRGLHGRRRPAEGTPTSTSTLTPMVTSTAPPAPTEGATATTEGSPTATEGTPAGSSAGSWDRVVLGGV